MSEIAQLLTVLKKRLRSCGLNYRDVAAELGLSEPSVKRLFASGGFTLERLAQVARLAGFTLAELAQEAAAGVSRISRLTERQEGELVSDIKLVLVGVCALNHWTMAEILATYQVTESECIQRLARLDRLGLIELLPGNRIRLLVARDFNWLPDGPIRRFFRHRGEQQFLDADFAREGEVMAFAHGMLTRTGLEQMQKELWKLKKRFAELHEEATTSPMSDRYGSGLLLAMRSWEPAEFAKLRRR